MEKRFFEPVDLDRDAPQILVDSGAFSTWESGKSIDLDHYGEYLVAAKKWAFAAVSLDQIAGSKNEWPTPNESEAACITSYQNWRRLKAYGIPVMPVHHQGDDIRWLYRYLDEGATYVGVSPTNKPHTFPTKIWQPWLYDVLWELEKGGGLNKDFFAHGFGVFSARFLPELRGLMWSADAINLTLYSTRRRVMLPYDSDGVLTDRGPLASLKLVYVGRKSPRQAPRHFDWTGFAHFVRQLNLDAGFVKVEDRYVAKNIYAITAMNAHALRLIMKATGVRMFVAGLDERVFYQLSHQRYPYMLRSFAHITERTGRTIRDLYFRNLRRPMPARKGRDRRISTPEPHKIS